MLSVCLASYGSSGDGAVWSPMTTLRRCSTQTCNGKFPVNGRFAMGNSSIHGGFSIGMLDYRRVRSMIRPSFMSVQTIAKLSSLCTNRRLQKLNNNGYLHLRMLPPILIYDWYECRGLVDVYHPNRWEQQQSACKQFKYCCKPTLDTQQST